MACSFTHSNGSVTFRAAPTPAGVSWLQHRAQSGGAVPVVLDYVAEEDVRTVAMLMTGAERDDLQTFILETVHGQAEPFTFTDGRGAELTVRFADSRFPRIVEANHDTFTTTVTLRVEV